jgi:PAS domain S-box-containing protein
MDGANETENSASHQAMADGNEAICPRPEDLTQGQLSDGAGRCAEDLAGLNRCVQQLIECLDFAQVAGQVTRDCVRTFGVTMAWLLRAEPDGRMEYIDHFPADVPYPSQVTIRWDDTPQGRGPTGRAVRGRKPVVFGDIAAVPDYIPWRTPAMEHGFITSCAIPLVGRDGVFGCLNLYSHQRNYFSRERVDFFQTFANQATVAMENARLLSSLQQELDNHRRAEESLRRSEEHFRKLYEAVQVGVLVQRADGMVIHANQTACEILGMDPDAVLGKTLLHACGEMVMEDGMPVPREDRPCMVTFRTGRPIRGVVRGFFYDDPQRLRWLLINMEPLQRDEAGNVEQVLATFQDITERKQLEDSLHASEERFRAIAANTPDHVLVQDTDLRYVWVVNPQLGLTEKDMIGKTDFDLLPSKDAEMLTKIKKAVLASGEQVHVEVPLTSLDGSIEHFDGSYVSKRGPDGQIDGLVGYFRNATDRKKVEEELRENQERLALAASGTQIGMYEWNVVTGEILATEQVARLFGLRTTTTTTTTTTTFSQFYHYQDWAERVHPEDLPRVDTEFRRCTIDQTPYDAEYRVLWPDGSTHWIIDRGIFRNGLDSRFPRRLGVVMDVTDRRRAEEALRESEERFRLMFEDHGAAMLLIEPQSGAIVDANTAAARFYGYSHEHLREMRIEDINQLPPEQVAAERAAALAQQRDYFVFPHRVASGEIRWVEVYSSPVQVRGAPLLFSIVHDVTERKQMEESLRRSEAKYRMLHESLRDGFVNVDMNGHLVEFNEIYREMLRYSDDELHRLTYRDLTPQKWHAMEAKIVRDQILARGYSDVYEKEYRRKDGSVFPVELRTVLIRDAAGQPSGMWAIVHDITRRKRTESALRESEARLALFFGQSLDGFFFMMLDEPVQWDDTVDKDRVIEYVFSHHRVTKANQAMMDQYGATPEEFIGLTPQDFWKHDLPSGKRVWREFFDKGRLHAETAERKLDGTPIWIDGDYICFYDDQGRITGHFGVQRDITARRQADEQLLHYQQRLRSLTAKAAIAEESERRRIGVGLHDHVGQGLAMAKLSLQTASEKAPRATAKVIAGVCTDLDRLADQLRSLSFELSDNILYEVGLNEAMDAYIEREVRRKHGIECQFIAADLPELGLELKCVLLRCFRELVINIIKHARAKHVCVRSLPEEAMIRLEVADDGQGMRDACGDAAASESHFGIFSIRQQIEALGGTVDIRSEPEQGTRVTIVVPVQYRLE